MYKLNKDPISGKITSVTQIKGDTITCIPFVVANTDYQQFKSDVLAGEQLQDADGNPMTQQQADDFIKELP
jgi:hypothetical protein